MFERRQSLNGLYLNVFLNQIFICDLKVKGLYKIVFVDDERFTIKTFANTVQWEKYNFELCGVFTNGFDCLDYVKNNHIDAIISDIRMPQMDGITLVEEISEIQPDVRIVLLSAHKDFEYAVKAVKLKVFDYLVKPVDCKAIENLLVELAKELLNNKVKENKAFTSDENIRIQKLLIDYMEHKNEDFLRENIVVDDRDLKAMPVVLLRVVVPEIEMYMDKVWRYGITGFYNAVNNMVNAENRLIFPLKYSAGIIDFIMFSQTENFSDALSDYEAFKNSIVSECFEIFGLDISVDIISSGECFEKLADKECQDRLEIQKRMVVSLLEEKNTDGVQNFFSRFTSVFSTEPVMIRTFYISVLNELLNLYGIEELENINSGFAKLYSVDDDELKRCTEEICIKLSGQNESSYVYDLIKIAKEYVAEHIEHGISLAEVAEVVAFSPSHFGRIFKEKTGEKFLNYVNRARIETAQHYLLTTGMKVNEIYEKVGYKSRNHFYSMFKLVAGCSPQEYRNKMSKLDN